MHRHLNVDRQDEVARELDRLETKYFRLVVNAQKTMVEANLSVIELETFSKYYFNDSVEVTINSERAFSTHKTVLFSGLFFT